MKQAAVYAAACTYVLLMITPRAGQYAANLCWRYTKRIFAQKDPGFGYPAKLNGIAVRPLSDQ
ncbi:MAG: hypothetical protein VB035_03215 [Candidatus Fimivivens sp.]|nr:hypothetical protein [Candidatus Fimivivens sp.]